jgi:hypothetical protein
MSARCNTIDSNRRGPLGDLGSEPFDRGRGFFAPRLERWVRARASCGAAVHDSQVADDILDPDNTASEVWADRAYRSAEVESKLKEKGLKSRIHRKGRRNKPLSEREKRGNKTRSRVRARVEHVFGSQSNDMGGTLVRSIGLVRARARIGPKNLACNMRRLVQPKRLAAAAPSDGHRGRGLPGACNERGTAQPGRPRTPKPPMPAPARDPREPRDLPSFTSIASFFEARIFSILDFPLNTVFCRFL